MSKREKMLAAWKTQPQPNADVETVEAILAYYFEGGFTVATGGSHQFRINHSALFGHAHFVGGTLSIPVSGGQTIRPIYLKRIVEAIEIVQAAEGQEDNNGNNEEAE